jgi:hypothetical protein
MPPTLSSEFIRTCTICRKQYGPTTSLEDEPICFRAECLYEHRKLLLSRIHNLRSALLPFAFFYSQWMKTPISSLDDILYAIHWPTPEGATFRLSDCKHAYEALQSQETP